MPHLVCTQHGPLAGKTCEPCEARELAQRVLDPRAPDVPLSGQAKRLLATYALRALDAEDARLTTTPTPAQRERARA